MKYPEKRFEGNIDPIFTKKFSYPINDSFFDMECGMMMKNLFIRVYLSWSGLQFCERDLLNYLLYTILFTLRGSENMLPNVESIIDMLKPNCGFVIRRFSKVSMKISAVTEECGKSCMCQKYAYSVWFRRENIRTWSFFQWETPDQYINNSPMITTSWNRKIGKARRRKWITVCIAEITEKNNEFRTLEEFVIQKLIRIFNKYCSMWFSRSLSKWRRILVRYTYCEFWNCLWTKAI